jgi:hypothetical protein
MRTSTRFSIIYLMAAGVVLPFFFPTATRAQSNDQWWTTVGSAGTADEASTSNVVYDGPTATVRPHTSATIRYNVTPEPSNASSTNQGCLILRVRYRDEFNPPSPSAGHFVPIYEPDGIDVVLNQEDVFSGQETKIAELHSDEFPAQAGFQTQQSTTAGINSFLDFSHNAYWVEVQLKAGSNPERPNLHLAPTPGSPPAISAIQIILGCQLQ